MIFRLFSPHGHGQCKAMRYISKHEADVYLDKEEKTERTKDGEKKALTSAFSSNVKFWTALQWSQFPFLHNAVGWSCVCFAFLYSSLKSRGNISYHNWTKIGKLTIIWNSLLLKTASRKIYYTHKWNLKKNKQCELLPATCLTWTNTYIYTH